MCSLEGKLKETHSSLVPWLLLVEKIVNRPGEKATLIFIINHWYLYQSLFLIKEAYSDKAVESLSLEIAKAIGGNYPKTNIINPNFNCAKVDDKYITFTGALLATETLTVSQLLNSVETWVRKEPQINIQSLIVIVDSECSVRISALNSTCQARGQTGGVSPETGASSSRGAAVTGLAAAFVVVSLIAVSLVVVVGVLIMLLKSKKNVSCPPSDNVKVK